LSCNKDDGRVLPIDQNLGCIIRRVSDQTRLYGEIEQNQKLKRGGRYNEEDPWSHYAIERNPKTIGCRFSFFWSIILEK
jgi:hypothetical protein